MKKVLGAVMACLLVFSSMALAEEQRPTEFAWQGYALVFIKITDDPENVGTTDPPQEGEKLVEVAFDSVEGLIAREDTRLALESFALRTRDGALYTSGLWTEHGFDDNWRYAKNVEGFGLIFSVPEDTDIAGAVLIVTPREGEDPMEMPLSDVVPKQPD